MKYDVDLTYPKQSRQPVYSIQVEAASRDIALNAAILSARQEGWKGTPIKNTVTQAREKEFQVDWAEELLAEGME